MKIIETQILMGLLKGAKHGARNQIISDCPWCGKEKHFFVNKGTTKKLNGTIIFHGYDCKKCQVNGAVFTLLAKLNASHLLGGRQIGDREKLTKFEFEEESEESQNYSDYIIENKKLPIGSRDLPENSESYKYLLSRKFTDIDFELYQPKFARNNKKFKDYVIIPIYQDFEIKGYVGRYIGDDNEKPRYLNSKDTEHGKLLGGFDEIHKNTKTLILVEGYFDKFSVTTELGLHFIDELKCCCTWGKKVTDYHIWLILNRTNVENIVLMWDGSDAVNDMKKSAFKIDKYFHTTVADTGFYKDPGNSNKRDFENMLQNLYTPNEFWFNKIQKKKF